MPNVTHNKDYENILFICFNYEKPVRRYVNNLT